MKIQKNPSQFGSLSYIRTRNSITVKKLTWYHKKWKFKKFIITKMINVNHNENGKHWTKKSKKPSWKLCMQLVCGPCEARIFYPSGHFRKKLENIEKMERIFKNMNMSS